MTVTRFNDEADRLLRWHRVQREIAALTFSFWCPGRDLLRMTEWERSRSERLLGEIIWA